ncbi:hypothetical protein [Pseudomonas sp. KNUC1026]|uniref:hypothetical protein n=1 Tax=Pseudomonas sp. KNUC1026 TaxID=2893890 RepID=UPI001F3906EB|nr:hypothetical protein [Pseudomonas sp. KNUC1026]UFH48102.1 hypothetical protein LN139_12845 [Pseudomonas sp. KNUC1026]
MSTVQLQAAIKARWLDGQCSRSPGSTEELAILAVDLLVRELGPAAARGFMEQALEHFTQAHWPLPAAPSSTLQAGIASAAPAP